MAGPYDYSINIPQPPAQNFLQSLLGIQQLKQMQQQSQLAEQQAAIQQQNAAFQQEMQPLERQRVETGIAASKAAADYSTGMAAANKYQLDRRKDLHRELDWIASDSANLTADNLERLAVKFHDLDANLLPSSAKMRSETPLIVQRFGDNVAKNLATAYFTGDPEEGKKVISDSIKAAEADPRFQSYVPRLKSLQTQYINDPGKTATTSAFGMFMMSPEVAKDMMSMVEQFATTKEKQAKAGQMEAQTEDLIAKRGTPDLTEDARKIINTSMTDALALRSKANAAADLANRFEQETKNMSFEGGLGSFAEFMKRSFGAEDAVSQMKKDYIAFRGSEAATLLKDLRPASDTDVDLVMRGFLSENADQATIAKYLRGMAKIRRYEAELNAGKSDWVEQVGTLGKSRQNLSVNDVTVPKGTNFLKYSRMLTQRLYVDDVVADYQSGRITREQADKFINQAKNRKF